MVSITRVSAMGSISGPPIRRLFLQPVYRENPFDVAAHRLGRKKDYQAQRAGYEKVLTKSRIAQWMSASINWSPWLVYLSGSKLVDRWLFRIPPSATLPGLVAFSIAATPFLSEIHEKIMKRWKRPPALVERKQKLEQLGDEIKRTSGLTAIQQQCDQGEKRFLPGIRFHSPSSQKTAVWIGSALISRYREPQEKLKALLPKLRGKEQTRKTIIPALRQLFLEANEQTGLLGQDPLDAMIEPMMTCLTQERTLLQKKVDPTEERLRYKAHLEKAIPQLIDYLSGEPE